MLRFIVIADSHIRQADEEVDAYPSNAWMIRRNEAVVALCNTIDASFVVHLGDIVHPLPVEKSHVPAIALARGVYDSMEHPIHFVAGNHDVGDKPNSHVAVPAVAEENYPVFESAWGPAFSSFDEGECHFVIVDAQILNSGFDREARQRVWLESDLAAATSVGQRIFLFTHYPPFVRARHENEHYDNIAEPARSWLLDLCAQHSIEAMFSGHVHNFLYNRHEGTDLYVAPSTGFVRPDYAELAAVPPTRENGRDDPPKLGVFVVDVTDDGHTVRPVRTFGALDADGPRPVPISTMVDPGWESPIGVTLGHGWMPVVDFPASGLDEFNRKRIRNDATLLALWEARITEVRVPLADLDTAAGMRRVADLGERGIRFSVFSPGVPGVSEVALVDAAARYICRWEVVVEPDRMKEAVRAVESAGVDSVTVALAPILPIGSPDAQVHHFVAAGWPPDVDLGIMAQIDPGGVIGEVVFHIGDGSDIGSAVDRVEAVSAAIGRRAVVIAGLPRGTESVVFDDDEAVSDRVSEVARVARAHTDVAVFLDGFMDHDRGYYPRHGLIDRAFNPRPALYRLIEAAASGSA